MSEKLPDCFVIETKRNSHLWAKFESYINEVRNIQLPVQYKSYKYYGLRRNVLIGFERLHEALDYGASILTLEQWAAIAMLSGEVAEKPKANDSIKAALLDYEDFKRAMQWDYNITDNVYIQRTTKERYDAFDLITLYLKGK